MPPVNQPSLGLLRTVFGFESFRPGQEEAIGSLLNGNHVLAVMPTGAGKSLIYQYAAFARRGTTVVISPLISLMQDQVSSLTRRQVPATFINSSLPGSEQLRRMEAMARGEYYLVYVAPERLRSAKFRQALSKATIGLLAVDEAHCISQWGHDFRPDYLHIADARQAMGEPLTVALTATATPRVRQDITARLGLSPVRHVVTGFNRPNLSFSVVSARDPEAKMRALMKTLSSLPDGGAIVYAGTRRDAEEVAEFVGTAIGKETAYYHAGMTSEDRASVQDRFTSGKLPVVVATNAFGMGIDRPDVRMVVHYSIPGTLEEYYQEAGRAGRDGKPADVVLIYSPHDRSLQEYFIETSEVRLADLKSIHSKLRADDSNQAGVSYDDLSIALGMNDTAIRLAIQQLEAAGAVHILARDGLRWSIKTDDWHEHRIRQAQENSQEHLAHRREQLERMVAYAETNLCRRKMILAHFGDTDPASAEKCCDNCSSLAKLETSACPTDTASLTDEHRTAHLIMDAFARLKWEVGVGKLAKILKGSNAQDVKAFGYDKNPYFGRLASYTMDEIKALIGQLIDLGYLKLVGGQLPVLRLTNLGGSALDTHSPVPLKLPERVVRHEVGRRSIAHSREHTVEVTAQMFADGMKPAEIATERGLTESTIIGHLAHLVAARRVELGQVVNPDVASLVREAIKCADDPSQIGPIKASLPEHVTYGEIRCVMAADGLLTKRVYDAPPRSSEQAEPAEDAVTEFLSKSHPRPLKGPWSEGWSLGFHSSFAGSDWSRSGVGELTHRLKYRQDGSAIPELVKQALDVCRQNRKLAEVDAIVPTPPSTAREFDHLQAFADALGGALGLPVRAIVEKTRATQPQKEMRTLAQKRANVAGAYAVKLNLRGRRVLLVDDLYDSGATLEEITRTLHAAGASSVCVLTLTRTIHSDK